MAEEGQNVDLIIGSDLLYQPEAAECLLEIFDLLFHCLLPFFFQFS